jgi:hypothetical protein
MTTQPNNTQPIYREVQRFRQIWIWLVVLALAGLIWYALITQLFFQRPFGNNPLPDVWLIIFWIVFSLGLPLLIFYCRLTTEVREDGLYIQFFPFHLSFRKIAFDELKRYEVRTYNPIWEYGGWGIRYRPKGWAYNVSGNQGVQLELVNGKRLLIGSQRAEELWQAIRSKKPTTD